MADVLSQAWLAEREAALLARLAPDPSGALAASSGCAEDAAHRLAYKRSDDAALALSRLRQGLLATCLTCGGSIPADRLEASLTAVRCATC